AHESRVQRVGDFRSRTISGRGLSLFKLLRRRFQAIGRRRSERETLRRRFEEGRGDFIAHRRRILRGREGRAISRRGFSLFNRLRRRFRPSTPSIERETVLLFET